MYAPCTCRTITYLVFAKGGTMTVGDITKCRFILRPNARPWIDPTSMTDQAKNENSVFTKIPYHKALYTGRQAHVDQNAVVGIVAFISTKQQRFFCLLFASNCVDMLVSFTGVPYK